MKSFAVDSPKSRQFTPQHAIQNNQVYDEVEVKSLAVDGQNIEKVSFIDSQVSGGSWAAAEMTESLLRRTVIKGVRMSGLVAHTLVAENIEFIECKLDMANLRSGKFKNVIFIDCVLTESDFQGSSFINVRFSNCDIDRLSVNNCTFSNVDMRSSKFTDLQGASSLKGVTMSREQLIMLAPVLANEIGIIVEA